MPRLLSPSFAAITAALATRAQWRVVLFVGCYFAASIALTVFNKWFFGAKPQPGAALPGGPAPAETPLANTSVPTFAPLHQFSGSGKGTASYNFHFPLTVTCAHQLIVSVLVVIFEKSLLLPVVGEISRSRALFLALVPIGFVSGIDWGLSNQSLRTITLSLYEMVKGATPVVVMLIAFALRLSPLSWQLVCIVAMITVGTVLAVTGGKFGALTSGDFPREGFACVFVAMLLSGVRLTLIQRVLQAMRIPMTGHPGRTRGVNAVTALYYAAPSSAAVLVFPALFFEGEAVHRYIADASWERCAMVVFWVVASSVLAFLLTIFEYLVTRVTSALTLCVVGITKQMLIICLAMALFGDRLNPANLAGFLLALLGIFLYKTTGASASAGRHPVASAGETDDDDGEEVPAIGGGLGTGAAAGIKPSGPQHSGNGMGGGAAVNGAEESSQVFSTLTGVDRRWAVNTSPVSPATMAPMRSNGILSSPC